MNISCKCMFNVLKHMVTIL